jgi:hypothetical protein
MAVFVIVGYFFECVDLEICTPPATVAVAKQEQKRLGSLLWKKKQCGEKEKNSKSKANRRIACDDLRGPACASFARSIQQL